MNESKRGSLPHSSDASMEARAALLRDELRQENTQALLDRLETMVETEEIDDIELLSAILDVLDEKAPLPESDEDPAEGLARLKAAYAPVFDRGEEKAQKKHDHTPKPFGKALKYVAVVAVIFGVLLTGMVGAQAAGWDIFGALAQWTEDTFHFATSRQEVSPYYETFRQALEDAKLPGELAPSWYPKGFQASEPETWSDKFGTTVYMDLERSDERALKVSVELSIEAEDISNIVYEKDDDEVEVYTSNSKSFYIFENIGTVVATWSDGTYTERISGDLSVAEIKKIINSIGVLKHD